MNLEDQREAFKWAMIATVIIALWCGVTAVRKARSELAGQEPSRVEAPETRVREPTPIWVILVYETKGGKLVGITEFVFLSYDACQRGAEDAKRSLGLHIRPMCYLRWLSDAGKNAM